MDVKLYLDLKDEIIRRGYAEEVDWSESVKPCISAVDFFCEYAWVVINSGMKNQVAEGIWRKVRKALAGGRSASAVFGHIGKCAAIDKGFRNREDIFLQYQAALDKIEYLKSLPWIGDITKWHLAKNLGFNVCKPDRHLVRIAGAEGTTCQEMCKRLADATGDRIATVDMVIWRAANLGLA